MLNATKFLFCCVQRLAKKSQWWLPTELNKILVVVALGFLALPPFLRCLLNHPITLPPYMSTHFFPTVGASPLIFCGKLLVGHGIDKRYAGAAVVQSPPHTVNIPILVFMISEPLAGRRETVVTQSRTALDFAEILRYTSDTLYPRTEKIVLVTDNLNTHSPASLYKAFPPEEARRLAERFEWHYTPKHGSWLDMAEIEIGIMSRQALGKPLPDLESFKQQVRTWTIRRNAECAKINWQFKTQDARIKLARLYPVIV